MLFLSFQFIRGAEIRVRRERESWEQIGMSDVAEDDTHDDYGENMPSGWSHCWCAGASDAKRKLECMWRYKRNGGYDFLSLLLLLLCLHRVIPHVFHCLSLPCFLPKPYYHPVGLGDVPLG